jgi:hypothetical protein
LIVPRYAPTTTRHRTSMLPWDQGGQWGFIAPAFTRQRTVLLGAPQTDLRGGQATAPGENREVAPAMVPFTRAGKEVYVTGFDISDVIDTNTEDFQPQDVPAFGYLRHVLLHVECTGAAVNAGTATAFAADGPWNAIQSITLHDVNGAPIVGPIDGLDLMYINKYGGYNFEGQPAAGPVYDATFPNFRFVLRLPVEISLRDALGALTNMNASATFKVSITRNQEGNLYNGTILTDGTLRIRAYAECWSQPPNEVDGAPAAQEPPARGTTQYWSRQIYNLNSGEGLTRLTRVGNLVRTLILVKRSAAGVRENQFPSPVRLMLDDKQWFNVIENILLHQAYERYGYTTRDTGVLVIDFAHDFDYHPGGELRDGYLPTLESTKLEVGGSWGTAGTLRVLTNDVAPVGNIFV